MRNQTKLLPKTCISRYVIRSEIKFQREYNSSSLYEMVKWKKSLIQSNKWQQLLLHKRGKNKDESRIAKAIAQEFIGIKRMWVNYLTEEYKEAQLNAMEVDQSTYELSQMEQDLFYGQ